MVTELSEEDVVELTLDPVNDVGGADVIVAEVVPGMYEEVGVAF